MKLAKDWYKAASTWAAAAVTALPNIADALFDLAPYLGEHGKTALTVAGLLMFIARVYPQASFENAK
jgi:hypothetical protein